MDAHVLHIGIDDCHRVAVLRSVGYRVEECASLLQLGSALERGNGADAVFLTESDGISQEQAIMVARERSMAPVILFRRTHQETTEEAFDLVVQPLTSPTKWLQDVESLLARSRVMRGLPPVISGQSRLPRIRKMWPREPERVQRLGLHLPDTSNLPPRSH